MAIEYVNLDLDNVDSEHLCCAIADKKHQCGVLSKKDWLKSRIKEGHVFRKLNQKGKVFIEYAPLEMAWTPIIGENYLYIYCLWVAGSFKGKGYAKDLLTYCIEDARRQGKAGVCVLSSTKKKPFLSDKKFFLKYAFEVVARMKGEYELLALSLNGGSTPRFTDFCQELTIKKKTLTVYYSPQCPYTSNCIEQMEVYCEKEGVPLHIIKVDTLEKAKKIPCLFNNWAVFYKGKFHTPHLLNEGFLKKLLAQ